jgi:amino acid adenylation domain-containing protein
MSDAVPPLTLAELREGVARLAGQPADTIGDDDDLIAVGLDSIDVMKLASIWLSRGAQIRFGELLERRTLRAWWELVAARLVPPAGTPTAATSGAEDDTPFELATMQYAYWFGRGHGQALSAPSHFYFEFDGEQVEPARLEAALRRLFARHPMLRARFLEDGRQQILPETPWKGLVVHDLRARPESEVAAQLEALRTHESSRRLEVERGLGLDVQLSLLPAGRTRVHVNIDMLIADAASFRIVISELAELYAQPAVTLPEIAYSFQRYLADKRQTPPASRDREYWAERLAELPGPPRLPFATEPERLERVRCVRREQRLGAQEWQHLSERARAHGVTLAMTFLTALSEVLAAWSTSPRFLLNLPLFDRQPLHPDAQRLVGDFTGSVLLAVDVSGACSFAERARRLQERFRADVAHAGYPGVSVLRDLWRAQPEARSFAPVVFTSALGMGALFSDSVRAAFGHLSWMISQTPQVWLDNQVVENDGELIVNWDTIEGLLAEGVLDAMFDAYRGLLAWLADPASDWNAPPPDLLPAAQRAVRSRVNATDGPVPTGALHTAFFEHARRAPTRPAVLWGDAGCWTYGELAQRALRVAACLRAQSVQAGAAVAVSLPKGPEQVLAILGVLAAGALYVPIAPQVPTARRQRICAHAGVQVVVDAALLAEAERLAPSSAPVSSAPDALAYILYTSGSTGEPKGVEVSHGAALNTIAALNARYAVGPEDRACAVSALDFDLSVYDIFGLLSAGGAVVTLGEEGRRDARLWAEQVRRWRVTLWNSVPALLDMLLTAADADELTSLRLVLLGGDWVGVDLPARLARAAPGCRFVALGGTTETAIHSTVCEVTGQVPAGWQALPYGTPLRNVRCRVVDARGRDCPDWVAGEIWIGGRSVAAGYRGAAELSAQRFVEFDGTRFYRTGDLGRYWPDGMLEFLGRADFQVKLRGHRIELGEVEAVLASHPDVRRAVALAFGPERQRLGAVVVGRATHDELRRHATTLLPAYMVPERVLVRDELPLSANGKLDRAALAALLEQASAPPDAASEPPQGPIEARLAGLWARLLGTQALHRQSNFFALGGDSLLATRLLAELRAEGLVGASLRTLFEHPRLADFAATLSPGTGALVARIVPRPEARHEPFPMTEVQRAYWMGRFDALALGGVGSFWYWEFDGQDVDLERLEAAWNRLIERHDMLRVVFDDQGQQRVLAQVPRYALQIEDAPPHDAAAHCARLRAEAATRAPFELARWPLFEVRALRLGAGRCRLGFGFDYIALDALSIITLFAELQALYDDPAAHLPALTASFRDYVLGTQPGSAEVAAARAHWQARLDSLPAAPALPLRTLGPGATASFTRRELRLPAHTWQALKQRARAHDLTANTVLACAYAEILAAWSGGQDVTLNFTVFDRRDVHPDVPRLVGDFTSLLLVPHASRPAQGWLSAARRFQGEVWTGLEQRAFSALALMRELAARRGAAAALMPVVFTSTLGVADHLARLTFPFGTYAGGISQTPQVWLDNQVVESDGELLVNWDALEALFAPGVLDAMFAAYRGLLEWLAASGSDWSSPWPDLLPDDQRRVRQAVNDTAHDEAPRGLHARFFEQALAHPERPAVLWEPDACWSYGELAERALRLAAALRARGVVAGELVAVSLPKGPEQILAVLGVLAAGAGYVPVAPEQPATRRARILDNAGTRLVVDASLLHEAMRTPPLAAPVEAHGASLAYVIYTSGSTGEPKGVEVSHRAAVNTLDDLESRCGVGPADRVLAVSALDFDLSVYDIFGLLGVGGAVVTIDADQRRDAYAWAAHVQRFRVTLWNSVPALLDMLLTAAEGNALASLRVVLVSGDWVGLDLPPRLAARAPGCRFIALGGATEAAIWSNACEVDTVPAHWRSIPYGRPLRNARYRVVDGHGRDCPDWVAGELWIGGVGLARGYRGQPELSARSFVEARGERWYRTGDLGRYWPDGLLEFLGRRDFQIKIRGHRIELGELEAALERQPGVRSAVALAFGEGGQHLGAAVVGSDCDAATLREGLAHLVPAYMLPERLLVLEQLPLGANGKVDRAALAARVAEAPEPARRPHEAPLGAWEQRLAALWSELLRTPHISRHDNFFALGGDSLGATRLVQQARQRWGLELPLRALFSSLALADLAALLAQADSDSETGTIA